MCTDSASLKVLQSSSMYLLKYHHSPEKDDIFKKYEKIVALGFKNIQVRVHLELFLASLHIFTASHLGIRQK